jgi:hypothetical protein
LSGWQELPYPRAERAPRAKFLKAYQREPDNPTIINNLQLLNSSSRFIQREE